MKTSIRILLFIVSILLILLVGASLASAQTMDGYTITWWTTSGGGGTSEAAGYSLNGIIGQPAVGEMSGGGYTVTSGYLSGVVTQPAQPYQAYLPMVKR